MTRKEQRNLDRFLRLKGKDNTKKSVSCESKWNIAHSNVSFTSKDDTGCSLSSLGPNKKEIVDNAKSKLYNGRDAHRIAKTSGKSIVQV